MDHSHTPSPTPTAGEREVDVLVIGAGLSGIGAARHLVVDRPGTTFAVLEARERIGGTWDLFRYPGIRSDSDLHTFGYEFKPWTDDDVIADGSKILDYLHTVVAEYDLAQHMRFGHHVRAADFDSPTARWRVEVEVGGEVTTWSARWIFCATGYYRYDRGHVPDIAGVEEFRGEVVHPQFWPEDLDLDGRRVVVIGSGATAVTLVPALTSGEGAAAHVTMLQRTPTYVMPLPRRDRIAMGLRKVLGPKRAHALVRAKNIARGQWIWNLSRKRPGLLRSLIRRANVASLPDGYPVDTHFKPPYDPWDQRLCADPDGIFFAALRAGRADVVTDRIDRITPEGVRLVSGNELPADVIVTATGLEIQLMGGADLSVDGVPVDLRERMTYRSSMLTGVPNFLFAMGYTNQSWTLRLGLVCGWFTRLLDHMDRAGQQAVVVEPDEAVTARSVLDFDAGYVQRAAASLPRQGDVRPWTLPMDFYADRRLLEKGPLVDEHLRFFGPAEGGATTAQLSEEVTR